METKKAIILTERCSSIHDSLAQLNRKKSPAILAKIKYEEKIVQIKRVTKVVKGGKKMTFRAVVVIGDKRGKVGIGVGRAEDVNLAIDKAILIGKKALIMTPLTRNNSIPRVANSSFGACQIMLRPAAEGSGIIAGGTIKTVLELAVFKNVLAKQYGSKNILNNAKATLSALIELNEGVHLEKYRTLRAHGFYEKEMKYNTKISI